MFHIYDSTPDQTTIDQLEWEDEYNPSHSYHDDSWDGMNKADEEDRNAGVDEEEDPFLNPFENSELDEEEFSLLAYSY